MFPSLLQHPICVTHEGCQCAYLSHASPSTPLQSSLLSMLSLSLSLFFFFFFFFFFFCLFVFVWSIAVSSILPPNRQVLCAHQMFPSLLQHPICVTHEGCLCAYLSHASLPTPC